MSPEEGKYQRNITGTNKEHREHTRTREQAQKRGGHVDENRSGVRTTKGERRVREQHRLRYKGVRCRWRDRLRQVCGEIRLGWNTRNTWEKQNTENKSEQEVESDNRTQEDITTK